MGTVTYVEGAERMITAARLADDGLHVRFADGQEGVIPDADLKLSGRVDHLTVPRPHVIEIHLVDGGVEEVPWDFARHYADDTYQDRSRSTALAGLESLGERLRALRKEQGATQGMLAERVGISRVSLARIESGRQLPRYRTLHGLAEALGLPLDRLVGG